MYSFSLGRHMETQFAIFIYLSCQCSILMSSNSVETRHEILINFF